MSIVQTLHPEIAATTTPKRISRYEIVTAEAGAIQLITTEIDGVVTVALVHQEFCKLGITATSRIAWDDTNSLTQTVIYNDPFYHKRFGHRRATRTIIDGREPVYSHSLSWKTKPPSASETHFIQLTRMSGYCFEFPPELVATADAMFKSGSVLSELDQLVGMY